MIPYIRVRKAFLHRDAREFPYRNKEILGCIGNSYIRISRGIWKDSRKWPWCPLVELFL